MNKLDEMILSELVYEGESWVGKSYDQFSFSNTYASSTIQKHLYAFDKKAYRDRRVTCFMTQSRDEHNIDQLNAKEEKREKLASWYLSLPGIPAKEKAIISI